MGVWKKVIGSTTSILGQAMRTVLGKNQVQKNFGENFLFKFQVARRTASDNLCSKREKFLVWNVQWEAWFGNHCFFWNLLFPGKFGTWCPKHRIFGGETHPEKTYYRSPASNLKRVFIHEFRYPRGTPTSLLEPAYTRQSSRRFNVSPNTWSTPLGWGPPNSATQNNPPHTIRMRTNWSRRPEKRWPHPYNRELQEHDDAAQPPILGRLAAQQRPIWH